MKRIFILLAIISTLLLTACGHKSDSSIVVSDPTTTTPVTIPTTTTPVTTSTPTTPAHVYSGKVYVDCANLSSQCSQASTAPILRSDSTDTTTLPSDVITQTINTYDAGDISLATTTSYVPNFLLYGSIINDTPSDIKGFWYCAMPMPLQLNSDGTPIPSVFTTDYSIYGIYGGVWRDSVTIPAGSTINIGGGYAGGYGVAPGSVVWVIKFFDTTSDPVSAPSITSSTFFQDAQAYEAIHTPRALGYVIFNIVP